MNSGKLDQRITIQRKTSNNPALYIDVVTVWAAIKNSYGKEFIEAQAVNLNISKTITIRYKKYLDPGLNKNVTKDYRILYKNMFYNIIYIDNIREKKDYMEIALESE